MFFFVQCTPTIPNSIGKNAQSCVFYDIVDTGTRIVIVSSQYRISPSAKI